MSKWVEGTAVAQEHWAELLYSLQAEAELARFEDGRMERGQGIRLEAQSSRAMAVGNAAMVADTMRARCGNAAATSTAGASRGRPV